MSDDTTTWLKKNPTINPLRRSLKTSLRFHVPNSEMNSSIMSNPDKVKDQGLFIPRMLQRSNMQMRKSRASVFKVPEMAVNKPVAKKDNSGSGAKQKKVPTPNGVVKSLLPVPKSKVQSNEKKIPAKSCLSRPSFIPRGSSRRTAMKRELLKRVVELSEIKRKEAQVQLNAVVEDNSVLRSILKKRASLRRNSQISAKKTKAKKVLFDGFENDEGEKENDANVSVESQNDFAAAMDEPTVFLNLPRGMEIDDSPFEPLKQDLDWTVEVTNEATPTSNISSLMTLWESYKENLNSIQTERNSLEDSLESLLKHSLDFHKKYQSYRETSEELYSGLSKLGQEIEEKLKAVAEGGKIETVKRKRRSSERRSLEKAEKIKMSDKSKLIKKNSGRKSMPLLKKDLKDFDDSFNL